MRVRPVGDYPQRLLQSLRASAPEGIEDPTIVVLTPGVYNSAYFEHTLLARLMGVELVEGRDLYCSGGRVFMRTTAGPTRVDVIYRRVDDEFLDPLQFRADSMLGSPGLMLAARLGNVTIANAIGNGVADDKLVYTYLPDLIRYYLSEEPILPNVDTWRLEEPGALEEVLDRLDELVVKPVDGSGGKGLVVGPGRLEGAARRAAPRGCAPTRAAGSRSRSCSCRTIPTLVEDGMRPRHADLRPFAVNDGNDVWVLPGRADPRRPARGAARRQQLAGRRLEGHLGGRHRGDPHGVSRHAGTGRGSGRRDHIASRSSRPRATCRTTTRRTPRARTSRSSSSRGAGAGNAEPHRRVPLLDRPLHRAQRRHRAHPRRAPAAAARGPVDRGEPRLPLAAQRDGHRGRRRRARSPAATCSRSSPSIATSRHPSPTR